MSLLGYGSAAVAIVHLPVFVNTLTCRKYLEDIAVMV